MKQRTFITLFIIINIIFIALHIHKHTLVIKLSYQEQRLKKEISELQAQKNLLSHKLYELQKPSRVKQFAQEKLGMQKIKFDQIKKLNTNEQSI